MDDEYRNTFPDTVAEHRQYILDKQKKWDKQADKLSNLESFITAFDSIGAVSIEEDRQTPSGVKKIVLTAYVSNINREPCIDLLREGGTATWNHVEETYELQHEFDFTRI